MEPVFNLTQHDPTPSQLEAGVCPRPVEIKAQIGKMLTVVGIPTKAQLVERASALADMAEQSGCSDAMIGGAGPLMRLLVKELGRRGIIPLESFSERVSVDVPKPDGTVIKQLTFVHTGWWPAVD